MAPSGSGLTIIWLCCSVVGQIAEAEAVRAAVNFAGLLPTDQSGRGKQHSQKQLGCTLVQKDLSQLKCLSLHRDVHAFLPLAASTVPNKVH
jgi:hypothetical protein